MRFVGLQIKQNRVSRTMFIYQSEYVEKILGKFDINAEASVVLDSHAIL